jgi:hypothetical protein
VTLQHVFEISPNFACTAHAGAARFAAKNPTVPVRPYCLFIRPLVTDDFHPFRARLNRQPVIYDLKIYKTGCHASAIAADLPMMALKRIPHLLNILSCAGQKQE